MNADCSPPDGEINSQEVQLLLDVQTAGDEDTDATPKLNPQPAEDNDMTTETDTVTEQNERPRRHTVRPQFYQSDEVEQEEKEKRKATQP